MQSKKSESLALKIIDYLDKHFGNKLENYSVYNTTDEPYIMFNITFDAYNYFVVNFSYDRGSISCGITCGKYDVDLKLSVKWYDESKIENFLKELQQQIELRIPDKFLEFNVWK